MSERLIPIAEPFPRVDLACECGGHVVLRYNGGELDWAQCPCGRTYDLRATGFEVAITEPSPRRRLKMSVPPNNPAPTRPVAWSLPRIIAVAAVVAILVVGAVLLWGHPTDTKNWIGAGFLAAGVLGVCLVLV